MPGTYSSRCRRAVCRVYTEAKNSEDVEKISEELARKIQELVGIDIER
jgi:hypothetical protein